jgi:hypothetical protein
MSTSSETFINPSALNDWFLSLPPERQAILREDKWMLAEAAFAAGREQAVRASKILPEKVFEAGFDITEISGEVWDDLMQKYRLSLIEDQKAGWVWLGDCGKVITQYDPITGACHRDENDVRPDFASYIGISGNADFVASLFVDIQRKADSIKAESFGRRPYI